MFKKHVIFFGLIWFLLVLGCIGLLYTSSSSAKLTYQRLMSYSDQAKKESVQEYVSSNQQVRQQVSKQILYKKGKDRLQIRLTSAESDLVYSKNEGELVEQFKDLTCIMQDELIDTYNNNKPDSDIAQHMVRQFRAQQAVYSYKSGQLEAKEVEIADYLLPEKRFPLSLEDDQPFIRGTAGTLQFSLFKEPSMQAQGFQAIFHNRSSDQ